MKLRCLGAPECADLAAAAPQLKRAVIRFGRRSSRGDIIGGIDFALAIDLAGLRIYETEAVQDHSSIPRCGAGDSTRVDGFVSNSSTALAARRRQG